jgi:hypothetical protein
MDVHRPKKSYHMGSDTFPYKLVGGVKPTRNKYICQLGSSTQHIYVYIFFTNNESSPTIIITTMNNYIICFDTIFWWLKIAIFGAEISG